MFPQLYEPVIFLEQVLVLEHTMIVSWPWDPNGSLDEINCSPPPYPLPVYPWYDCYLLLPFFLWVPLSLIPRWFVYVCTILDMSFLKILQHVYYFCWLVNLFDYDKVMWLLKEDQWERIMAIAFLAVVLVVAGSCNVSLPFPLFPSEFILWFVFASLNKN